MSLETVRIERIAPEALTAAVREQVDAIFFATSSRSFEPGPERDAFRERWLGRYLHGGSDVLILALEGDRVAGYLVGAVENPALQARFDDIGYFRAEFAELCGRFPAHLHINLAADYRSQGVGARLIDAFGDYAAARGAAGMHAITGRGMRNVRFYERCGMTEQGSAAFNGKEVVFLARELPVPAA